MWCAAEIASAWAANTNIAARLRYDAWDQEGRMPVKGCSSRHLPRFW